MSARAPARGVRTWALGLTLALIAGCGTYQSGLQTRPRKATRDYADALSAATRTAWKTWYFERVMEASATLQTPAFLEARAAQEARYKGLPPAAAREWLEGHRARYEGPTVVLFLDTRREWEDLAQAGQDTWRVWVQAGGREVEPARVILLEQDDATYRTPFPYVHDFGALYLLVFPEDVPVGAIEALHLSGAPGAVELSFR